LPEPASAAQPAGHQHRWCARGRRASCLRCTNHAGGWDADGSPRPIPDTSRPVRHL